jgi:hypothetical protein
VNQLLNGISLKSVPSILNNWAREAAAEDHTEGPGCLGHLTHVPIFRKVV